MGWGIRSPCAGSCWSQGFARGEGFGSFFLVKVDSFLGENMDENSKVKKKDGESLVFSKKTRRLYIYSMLYLYIYILYCNVSIDVFV